MWPQRGGQVSPPMFPTLSQELQMGQAHSRPSNSHTTQILGPLQLAQTDIRSSVACRCTCKLEEEPIPYRETDYKGVKRLETDFNTPERLEADNVLRSDNMRRRAIGGSRGREPNALAWNLASKMIKHARDIKYPNEHYMWCPDCRQFPVMPVTGDCGHTRCNMCIRENGPCPCGEQAPTVLHLNILIQDLLKKMLPSQATNAVSSQSCLPTPTTSLGGAWENSLGPERLRRHTRLLQYSSRASTEPDIPYQQPLSPGARYKYARDLLAAGRHREAAPHLAHAAASADPVARSARNLLAKSINLMGGDRDLRRLTRELYRSVREHSSIAWLKPGDLECIICYQLMKRPVTTSCGHTFCRPCIERLKDSTKRCALCSRSLDNLNLNQTPDTAFVRVAMSAIDSLIPSSPPESEFVPIFACTVAFPAIPCPLLIFDPRYWVMIKRVLDSGERKFGMVAYERDRSYSDYGTILEVRDCVQFEDGRSILSTIGVSRFRVIERSIKEGCHMARIEELTDVTPPTDIGIWDLQLLAQQISYKALVWLSSLNRRTVADIEAAFGTVPQFLEDRSHWWENPNGPEWLWWLIAILPLRSEIQVLILSTKHLAKRMMAVSRTLEVMDQVSISPILSGCEVRGEIYLFYDNNPRRSNN